MISKFTLKSTEALTLETSVAQATALTFYFTFAAQGAADYDKNNGTFINTTPVVVVPAPAANSSRVTGSFWVRNPNAGSVTVIARISGVEVGRVTLQAGDSWTDKGVFDASGQLRSVGAAGTSPVIIRTSSTSRTIAAANGVSFTTNNVTNSGFIQGQRVRIAQTTAPAANWMEGVISAAVTATNVTVDVDRINGSGTINNWSIGLMGDNSTVVTANSTDTIALGTGSKTLNFPSAIIAIGFRVGSMVRFAADANNYMDGIVTNVTTTSITINVRSSDIVQGSGSFSSWGITIAGERGATGTQGNPGNPGNTGAQGSSFRSGAGAPSNALGNNDDSYLNTSNGDVYSKNAGTWTQTGNIKGTPGGAETVSPIAALPIDWATGKIQRLALSADLAPTPAQFQNPESGFAHVIILTNASGAPRTFTLPTNAAHFTPATRGVTVANNRRRTLSAIYDGTSYHWAVGEELTNQ